jgi:cyclophilin family peptidyl-prolyl cis-trans isomerase
VSIAAATATALSLPSCRRSETLGPPTVDVALEGLPRDAPIPIVLETTEGTVACELDPKRTPKSAAMFVGLATGRAPWRDPKTLEVVSRPLYSDLPFFRAIPGALVQSGCPLGDGTGTPGYRVPVEVSDDDRARLARPGALILARYTPPPDRPDPAPPPPGAVIGSQFVIGLTDMSHLTGTVTVIGSCGDLATAQRIAKLVASHEKSVQLVRVGIARRP